MEPIHRIDHAQLSPMRYLLWMPLMFVGLALIVVFAYRGGAAEEWPLLLLGIGLTIGGGIPFSLGRSLTWHPDRRMVTESRNILLLSWKDYFDHSSFNSVELRVQMPEKGDASQAPGGQERRKFRIYLRGVRSLEMGEFEEASQAAAAAERAGELLNLPVQVIEPGTEQTK